MFRMTGKMLLSLLFVLTLAVGLFPGIGTTALADGGYAITTPETQHGSVTVSPASGTF